MNPYLSARYGDPCRGCGFSWTAEPGLSAVIDGAPARYAELTDGRTGREGVPDLGWDVTGYVCHVADNTRIWAERLAGAARGSTAPIASYDEEILATARNYREIDLPAALWSLERAVGDWQAARQFDGPGFAHPEQGGLSPDDAERIVVHELHHHVLDVGRILGA
jgi:hypothetical protein